jgi:hypothetical protein
MGEELEKESACIKKAFTDFAGCFERIGVDGSYIPVELESGKKVMLFVRVEDPNKPVEDTCKQAPSLAIGEYSIYRLNDNSIWIERNGDEGLQLSYDEMQEMFNDLFDEYL